MAVATQKTEKAHVYVWVGTDQKGKKVKGETRGTNSGLVKADLRRQGIKPITVKKQSALFAPRKKKIIPKDIAVFSRQLATMMNSGVPLVQALDIIGKGHENPSVQNLVLTIKNHVEGGSSLTSALREHPLYFDDLYCNLVDAGEHAGVLEIVLNKIATYKEKTESLKGKIKKALFYPTAVIIVAVIVTAIILIFVIPQFESLFKSFGADLPAFTRMVMDLSRFTREWWWVILGLGVGGGYFINQTWKRSQKFREAVDLGLLRLPVIGQILHKASIARFARTLSTMFGAGVPLVEALDSVAGATGNTLYANAVKRMREDVATGQSLELTMKQQKVFPHMVIQMVAIGEESGALDSMLAKVADFYEEEVDNMVDALSSLLEPMIMSIIGGLVGSLVIAMYLPIFKLASVL